MAIGPCLVLCDEPTGSLDSASGREVRTLLRSLPRPGETSVVMVTHDPEAAADADRIVRIRDGRIEEAPDPKESHARSLSRP